MYPGVRDMGPWVAPTREEEVSRKVSRLIRAGGICLLVASVLVMLSGVLFILYDLPLRFIRDWNFDLDSVHYYYEILGEWHLCYVFMAVGIIGLFVGVHALSYQVSMYTLAYASFMVPIGMVAIVNLGLVIALISLVALGLFGAGWRLTPEEDPKDGIPSPYGAPTPQAGRTAAVRAASPIDMEGRPPVVLIRPAATFLLLATVAVLFMFSPQYPTYRLDAWQQWLLYMIVALGFAGVTLTAYERLLVVPLMTSMALFVVALVDFHLLLQSWYQLGEVLPLTFWISGTLSSLTIVYLITARNAFMPWRETLTSRSSPSPVGPRPR